MKTRAAVAWQAGQPLTIETVDLEGPKFGEVLVEIKATGICHTDYYTLSGADPEGIFPAILGHEGAGIVVDVGAGVTSVKKGDHVIPLYTPECRKCKFCLSRKTNLCQLIRAHPGQGPDARRHLAASASRASRSSTTWAARTFSQLHGGCRRSPLAKIREDAPFDKVCYIGCGVTTGIGAVLFTAKVEAGANVRGVRPGRHRPERDPGRQDGGRRQDHRRRHQPGPRGHGAPVRHDALREPEGQSRQRVATSWTPSCSSPTAAPTTASSASATPRSCARRWSAPTRAGAAASSSAWPKPAPRSAPGRSSSSPAASGKARPSAVRAAAPTCRKIVDWYMDGQDQHRRPDHPHHAAGRHQQGLRFDEARRINSRCRSVLTWWLTSNC